MNRSVNFIEYQGNNTTIMLFSGMILILLFIMITYCSVARKKKTDVKLLNEIEMRQAKERFLKKKFNQTTNKKILNA